MNLLKIMVSGEAIWLDYIQFLPTFIEPIGIEAIKNNVATRRRLISGVLMQKRLPYMSLSFLQVYMILRLLVTRLNLIILLL